MSTFIAAKATFGTSSTKAMEGEEGFEMEYSCAICLDIAEDAVETSCCHQLFCYDCINRVQSKCPMCRRNHTIIPSSKAEFIKNLTAQCLNDDCSAEVQRSKVKEHMRTCVHRVYTCPSEGCNFLGKRTPFKQHLIQQHIEVIVRNASYCFFGGVGRGVEENDDLNSRKTNDMGNNTLVGASGKYYCKQPIDREDDSITKNCGPNVRGNCKSCMKLDIAVRKLPAQWYVNKKGAPCRIEKRSGLFHCGRKWKADEPHCSAADCHSCKFCQEMQEQLDKRYSGIWQ